MNKERERESALVREKVRGAVRLVDEALIHVHDHSLAITLHDHC